MHDDAVKVGAETRGERRAGLDGAVTIEFAAGTIAGDGRNISAQGVFFTAGGSVPVTVLVEGHGAVRGHLVRLESMGDGRFGIAVRFDEPLPPSP